MLRFERKIHSKLVLLWFPKATQTTKLGNLRQVSPDRVNNSRLKTRTIF